jgi:hypothetical protein
MGKRITNDPSDTEFGAPWSAKLRASSLISMLVLAVIKISGLFSWSHGGWPVRLLLIALPLLIALGAARFMVRGYVLTNREIIVRRLGWDTRLPLDGLASVTGNNEAMTRSIRIFGYSGILSFTGEFWNRDLGRYRALATDPSRAVVLKYPTRRIVITPHDPQKFIVQARMLLKNREFLPPNPSHE